MEYIPIPILLPAIFFAWINRGCRIVVVYFLSTTETICLDRCTLNVVCRVGLKMRLIEIRYRIIDRFIIVWKRWKPLKFSHVLAIGFRFGILWFCFIEFQSKFQVLSFVFLISQQLKTIEKQHTKLHNFKLDCCDINTEVKSTHIE